MTGIRPEPQNQLPLGGQAHVKLCNYRPRNTIPLSRPLLIQPKCNRHVARGMDCLKALRTLLHDQYRQLCLFSMPFKVKSMSCFSWSQNRVILRDEYISISIRAWEAQLEGEILKITEKMTYFVLLLYPVY